VAIKKKKNYQTENAEWLLRTKNKGSMPDEMKLESLQNQKRSDLKTPKFWFIYQFIRSP